MAVNERTHNTAVRRRQWELHQTRRSPRDV
jgi:hypothetical protein